MLYIPNGVYDFARERQLCIHTCKRSRSVYMALLSMCPEEVKYTRYMRLACRRWLVHRGTCWKRLGRTGGNERGRTGGGEEGRRRGGGERPPLVGKDSSELRALDQTKLFAFQTSSEIFLMVFLIFFFSTFFSSIFFNFHEVGVFRCYFLRPVSKVICSHGREFCRE